MSEELTGDDTWNLLERIARGEEGTRADGVVEMHDNLVARTIALTALHIGMQIADLKEVVSGDLALIADEITRLLDAVKRGGT